MATSILTAPKVQFLDANGDPLSGGKVYFYAPGTATPKDTYSDYEGTTANANPVILDSRGEAVIRLDGRYDVTVHDSTDTLVYSVDDVTGVGDSDTVIHSTGGAEGTVSNHIEQMRGVLLAEAKAFAIPTVADSQRISVAGRTANGDGYAGEFYWDGSDLSTQVTGDAQNGLYIPPNSDTTGASGAWVRDWTYWVESDWFGATGDSVVADAAGTITPGTDNATALQAWIANSVDKGRPAKLGNGIYYTTGKLTPNLPADTLMASGRRGGIHVAGEGMYNSVIYHTLADYVWDQSVNGGADSTYIRDLSVKTTKTGGGGFKIPEGGNVDFERVFVNGSGAGYWGWYLDDGAGNGPYTVKLSSCRCWDDSDNCAGGVLYMADGHSLWMDQCFFSKQTKDGDHVYIGAVKNVIIPAITFEQKAQAATSSMVPLVFDGANSAIWIGTIHLEGTGWNKGVEFRTASAGRHCTIDSIYAWQKNVDTYGDTDCLIIDAPNSSAYPKYIHHILFKTDITAAPSGSGELINDPYDQIQLQSYSESASGSQAGRTVKRARWTDRARDRVALGTVTSVAQAFTLPQPGSYICQASILSTDGNHGVTRTFLVTFHDGASNDFTVSEAIGTEQTKGSGVAGLTLPVTAAGVITVTASGLTSRTYETFVGWRKLANMHSTYMDDLTL